MHLKRCLSLKTMHLKRYLSLKTIHLKRCLTVFIKSVKRGIKNRFNTFLKRCLSLHSIATDVSFITVMLNGRWMICIEIKLYRKQSYSCQLLNRNLYILYFLHHTHKNCSSVLKVPAGCPKPVATGVPLLSSITFELILI